jgi:hypothetical protein
MHAAGDLRVVKRQGQENMGPEEEHSQSANDNAVLNLVTHFQISRANGCRIQREMFAIVANARQIFRRAAATETGLLVSLPVDFLQADGIASSRLDTIPIRAKGRSCRLAKLSGESGDANGNSDEDRD